MSLLSPFQLGIIGRTVDPQVILFTIESCMGLGQIAIEDS